MAVAYLNKMTTKQTPQIQPLPGKNQVKNSAGGYIYRIPKWEQLHRFLILGTEGGTYYASEQKITKENAVNLLNCIQEDGLAVLSSVVAISEAGIAPKNAPAIFALAMCAVFGNEATKQAVFRDLPKVCRTGTHFLNFIGFVTGERGWGRYLRRLAASWYTSYSPRELAYQVAKYQSRDGWSHKDVLILAHPKNEGLYNSIAKWIMDGTLDTTDEALAYLRGHTALRSGDLNMETVIGLINEFQLARESVPTEWLAYKEVWEALLPHMPVTAMLRNLGTMTKIGVLNAGVNEYVLTKLGSETAIKRARLHPLTILNGMKVYAQGHGEKSTAVWTPATWLTKLLNEAFYLSFKGLEPHGKHLVVGVDVSGSMSSGTCGGTSLTPREVAAAMAMTLVRVEPQENIGLLAFTDKLVPLPVTKGMSLEEVVSLTSKLSFGGTDTSLPIRWAIENKVLAEGFITLTDNETWAGSQHTSVALKEYRNMSGIPARNIVEAFTATDFSIADPNDPLSLDVVGFDSSVPEAVNLFLTQNI